MNGLIRLQDQARKAQGQPPLVAAPEPQGDGFAELSPETLAAMSQAGTEGRAMPSIECD